MQPILQTISEYLINNINQMITISVLIFAIICVIVFRNEIKGILNRIGDGGSKENSIALPSAQPPSSRRIPDLNVRPDSAEADAFARVIMDHVAKSDKALEDKLELAVIDLANNVLRHEYEISYREIYGSQLESLISLKKEGPHALAKFHDRFLERYDDFKIKHPEVDIKTDFESWLSFLTGRPYPYATLAGGTATITNRGQDFLRYIAAMSLNWQKIL